MKQIHHFEILDDAVQDLDQSNSAIPKPNVRHEFMTPQGWHELIPTLVMFVIFLAIIMAIPMAIKKGYVKLRSGALIYRQQSPVSFWSTIVFVGASGLVAGVVFCQHLILFLQQW